MGIRRLIVGAFVCMLLLVARSSGLRADEWGSWEPMTGHNGVDFRVRCECDGQPNRGKYLWWVEFRNRYNERVSFDFRIAAPGERPRFSDRLIIAPGRTDQGWNEVAVGRGGRVEVWTENWKFGRDAN